MAEPTERIAILLEMQNEQFKKNARGAARDIDRLEKRTNPLGAALTKLKARQDKYSAALEAGTLTAARHAKGMDLAQREYEQTVGKINGTTAAILRMNSAQAAQTGFMARNRHIFQQGGYQVGDFAVQVQGGTSALTAFTQQGSQLLGVFGPWGAVMGAVLAVGAPLAGVLYSMGDATEDTKEKAKTFTDRLGDADAALQAMHSTAGDLTDLEGLRAKYGELTDEVRDMATALFEIDKRKAIAEVSSVIDDITSQIAKAAQDGIGLDASKLLSVGSEESKAELEELRSIMADLQADIELMGGNASENLLASFQTVKEQIALLEGDIVNLGDAAIGIDLADGWLAEMMQVQTALSEARDAGDFTEMANRLGEIRGLLIASGEVISQDVLDGITRSEAMAREQAARLEEGLDAANGIASADMVGNIAAAATSAASLRDILREARAASGAISGLDKSNPDFFDPRGESPDSGRANLERPNNSRRALKPKNEKTTKASRGGRKGSSGGKRGTAQAPLFDIAENAIQGLERQLELIGKSKGEIAALTTKHKLLDEAKKRGLTITEELTEKIDAESAEVGQLADKYDQARDKIAAMEQIQGQFKDSVIDAAMGGADAFDNFKDAIKRAALEYALFGSGLFAGGSKSSGGGLLGGLFGGGGGGFLGGLFNIGANANGTSNWRGGLTSVNERGGEIMNLPQGTQIIPNDISKRMADNSSGGGSMDVRVYVDDDGNWQAKVEQISGGVVHQAAPDLISRSVQATGQRMSKAPDFGAPL